MAHTDALFAVVFLWLVFFGGIHGVRILDGYTNMQGQLSIEIRFIVGINASWESCTGTIASPFLKMDTNWKNGTVVDLAKCDHGPLTFHLTNGSQDRKSKTDVVVTFYSSNIAASPPQCHIPWNFTYLDPLTQDPEESPLPVCYTNDSQEGYHATDFWFWIMDWRFV